MHAQQVADEILEALQNNQLSIADRVIVRVRTFEQAGIRYGSGLVVALDDGTEYHLSVVQSN